MAITIIQAMIPASILGGFDIPSIPYNEANSATFKTGALLTPNGTAGQLIEATAASPTTSIFGVALQAGQNVASAPAYPLYGGTYPAGSAQAGGASPGTSEAVFPLLVVPALPKLIFEAQFITGATDTAITSAVVFTKFGLTKDATSGFWYVDGSKTGAAGSCTVLYIKNIQDLVLGTTLGARVGFVINTTETVFV